jgi:hypothetical protein
MTEERISNAQRGFLDGRDSYEKIKGLTPKFEDWHCKRNLCEVMIKKEATTE